MYHPDCPSCRRFVETLRRAATGTPSLADVRAVNVMTMSPAQRVGIDSVPALVDDDGTVLAGTRAFEWLDGFRVAPDPFAGGFDVLGYAGLGGGAVGDGYQRAYAPLG